MTVEVKTATRYTCFTCGNVTEYLTSIPKGWYVLKELVCSHVTNKVWSVSYCLGMDTYPPTARAFCSGKCLLEYLKKQLKIEE